MPATKRPGYRLDTHSTARAARRPRPALRPGDLVKLCFLLPEPTPQGIEAERMWVRVRARRGEQYRGVLDSEPRCLEALRRGDPVTFGPEHVFEVHGPATRKKTAAVSKLLGVVVTGRVWDERVRPGFLRRDPHAGPNDSGWQIIAGDESEEYLDGLHNLRLVRVMDILARFPELEELLEAPPGTGWEWNEDEQRYERFEIDVEDDVAGE